MIRPCDAPGGVHSVLSFRPFTLAQFSAIGAGDVRAFNALLLVIESVAFEARVLVKGCGVCPTAESTAGLAVDVGLPEPPAAGALANEDFVLQDFDGAPGSLDKDESVAAQVSGEVAKRIFEPEAEPSGGGVRRELF